MTGTAGLTPVTWIKAALSGAALLLVVNQVFALRAFGFNPISTEYYYWIIALFFPVVFLGGEGRPPSALDWVLAVVSLAAGSYLAWNAETAISRGWDIEAPWLPTSVSIVVSVLAIEGVRRAAGNFLAVICAFFMVYPLFAGSMPGVFWGAELNLQETARAHVLGSESIIGIPMRVVSDLLIGFIVFGVALTLAGGGAFFMDFAASLMGRFRGGPAKVAVLSSGLFGSLSGSVISNVLSTGTMTIPTMIRSGYPPRYAAAVEACASTGGALMPPVMGVVAFVMASFLNIPYREVMIAALLPSLLYYAALLFQADAYAAREGLKGLPRSSLPRMGSTLAMGWPCLLGLGILIWLILAVGIEAQAPFWACIPLVLYGLWRASDGRGRFVLSLLAEGGNTIAQLVAILAGIGMVVGALSITGVGTAFSRGLIQYAGDSAVLLLVLGALTSFVLGMGMTSSACYIFLAIILGPALEKAGLDPLASHLFILYWGMLSFITPPVALAAVAAAGVAKAPAMSTGLLAARIGLVLFVIPFLFVLNPALILKGEPLQIAFAASTALLAVICFAAGSERWLYGVGRIGRLPGVLMLCAAACFIVPELISDVAGLAFAALAYLAARGRPQPAAA